MNHETKPMKRRPGKPSTFPVAWQPLVDACEGVKNLAAVIDVSPTTVWRWAHGERVISDKYLRDLKTLCAELQIPCPIH